MNLHTGPSLHHLSVPRVIPLGLCSQAAVTVEKGSVNLISTEVLIVDNSTTCHLLRDIRIR